MKSATVSGCWMGLLLFLAAGCGANGEYVVERLSVRQVGWDTLDVQVAFGRRTLFRTNQPVTPPDVTVYLYGAAYDTLYAGAGGIVPVADGALGDRERLLLEVCGRFDGRQSVCEQQALNASPKRLRLEHDISFPEDPAFARGSYDLRFVVERQDLRSGRWERVERPARVRGYLLAYVGEAAAEAVRVPFARSRGRFDLKRYPHYDDFLYHLKSQLLDDRAADVRFDVYAALAGQEAFRLASVEKRIRVKTEDERREEVHYFIEQAAMRILEHLGVEEERARAYVDGWDFNRLTRIYSVEMELVWREGGRFFGRARAVAGLLEVHEDGTGARFLARNASGRAAQRWRRSVRGEALPLGTLEVYVPPEDAVPADSLRIDAMGLPVLPSDVSNAR